jgi:ketosteroid isomerase-like protein
MPVIARSRPASLFGMLGALLLILSSLGQRSSQAGDATTDQGLCARMWEDHLEAVMAGQPQRIGVAKDAVVLYPDMAPLRGREAIQAHLVKVFGGLKVVKAGFKVDRCEVVGPRVYTFAVVDETTQEGAAPPARRLARYATVWEQQPDKSWQIAHSLVNYLKP